MESAREFNAWSVELDLREGMSKTIRYALIVGAVVLTIFMSIFSIWFIVNGLYFASIPTVVLMLDSAYRVDRYIKLL